MRLLLLRHGETASNAEVRYQGPDVPLNDQGREQARAAGARLARYGLRAVYTSDLARAAETAAIVGGLCRLTPQPLPDLREIDVGLWAGHTPAELAERYPEHMAAYEHDPANTVRLGGESYAQLQVRAWRALERIQAAHQPGEPLLLVSHGGTLRTLICAVIGLELRHFGRIWLDNASISELRLERGAWRLLRVNDTAHFEGGRFAAGE